MNEENLVILILWNCSYVVCRLKRGTEFKEIVSNKAIEHWKNDSLYICGDDMEEFYAIYEEKWGKGDCRLLWN